MERMDIDSRVHNGGIAGDYDEGTIVWLDPEAGDCQVAWDSLQGTERACTLEGIDGLELVW